MTKKPKNIKFIWNKPGDIKKQIENCRYCQSKNIKKRGFRKTKIGKTQLYYCHDCHKTFSDQIVKHKEYPLKVILEAVSLYNLGYSNAETRNFINERYGLKPGASTIDNWLKELKPLCRYARLRPKAIKLYPPQQTIQSVTFRHKQVYHYRYHRAKLDILLKSHEFSKYNNLKVWLNSIKKDCPHDLFLSGERSSQTKAKIDLNQVQVNHIQNHATRLANLLLQAVGNNRLRHDALQQFMLINDSVSVAMEVPIYLKPSDIRYFTEKLKFKIPFKIKETLTGHIDLLQLRNGLIHILDYKPNAKGEKPFWQLTLYALALSRLTGLKIMDFKCAWFDENDYFEFFPLHLVYKRPRRDESHQPNK
ncbi:PD-(D/E)XK nuclease family protein [uncultured Desulfosarcina sp.]|uniref:PD-(D/E)XK nuclease family protein n=1 Tax=uncultured Desulfosarcina sp. TaxID=218289 RepID=UPI0029C84C98|nr:PD-(D/E)XK nuclease family protein [uncultured Desulfosarcina sp.]